MDPDLQLDPLNPPKYCPQCARSGLKSKVKKFKMDPSSSEVVIMCKNGQVINTIIDVIKIIIYNVYIIVSMAILSAVPSRSNCEDRSWSRFSFCHQHTFTSIQQEEEDETEDSNSGFKSGI